MGIIINRRGRCIRQSVPVSLKLYLDLNDPQKPSPCPVAVFAFQPLDSYRDRMTQNMNRKHEKHTVPPPFEEVTNRLPFIAASLRRVYTAGGFLSNFGRTQGTPSPTGVMRQVRLSFRRGRCPHRPAGKSRILRRDTRAPPYKESRQTERKETHPAHRFLRMSSPKKGKISYPPSMRERMAAP